TNSATLRENPTTSDARWYGTPRSAMRRDSHTIAPLEVAALGWNTRNAPTTTARTSAALATAARLTAGLGGRAVPRPGPRRPPATPACRRPRALRRPGRSA